MIWDPCLARAVAAEVEARLKGARAVAVDFLRAQRAVRVHFREATLAAELTPGRCVVVVRPPSEPDPEAERLPAVLMAAGAVPDERMVVLRFRRVRGRKAHPSLILDLAANRSNAYWAEGAEMVVRRRLRGGGASVVGVGRPWAPPARGRRAGADGTLAIEEWLAAYPMGAGAAASPDDAAASLDDIAALPDDAGVPPDDAIPPDDAGESAGALDPGRVKRWMSQVAYLSPLNAPWLLSAAGPEAAFRRWRRLVAGTTPAPCLLRLPSGVQPYPWPMGDAFPATPVASLLAGMDAVLAGAEAALGAPADSTDDADQGAAARDGQAWALDQQAWAVNQQGRALDPQAQALDRERRRVERKLGALRRQLERTGEAAGLREDAALILSSLRQIEQGTDRVDLVGFDGTPRTLKLDPALRPQENAAAWFRLAARMERGAATLARRIRDGEAELARLVRAVRLHGRGELPPEELEAVLPAAPATTGRRSVDSPALPYRRYRTSGGLEVRVARGARRNDALTFHHSRPNDVWLHARHAAGAHVVLRWVRPERPPAADLAEAATLAANHSAARSSGHVPVDWTRRKWVRKPRGAPPGLVTPDRVQTVFVSPDPSLEERLRYRAASKA